MFFVSILTVFLFSWFLASLIRLTNKPAHFVFLYLASFGEVAFIAQMAHFFKALNNQAFFLGMQILLLLLVVWVWVKRGQPNLLGPWCDIGEIFQKQKWMRFFRKWPDVSLLFLAVVICLGIAWVLNYTIPPNNNDSISTHMSRVGYWLQQGSFDPWDTQKNKQLFYPVNAQVQMLWSILFSGSDHYVGLVQWKALLASMASVFGITRLLKATRPQAAFAALLLPTLPAILMQSTTTQNNIVTGALFAIMFYFFFLAVNEKSKLLFAVAGAALGIGLATNLTMLFLLPGFGAAILLVWLIYKQVSFRNLLVMGGGTITAFLLIGSVIFFSNIRIYNNPLGPTSEFGQATQGLESPADYILLNSLRLMYQAVDPMGLPKKYEDLGVQIKADLARPVFTALNIPIESSKGLMEGHTFKLDTRYYLQEDLAWYGPVGFLILFPAMLVGLLWGIKKKESIAISIILVSLGFLLCDALLRPGWDAYQGRYFIPVVILATPLIALWLIPGWRRWFFGLSIIALSMVVMYRTTFTNPAKPLREMTYLYPPNPELRVIWEVDRIERISFQSGNSRLVCLMVDQEVPDDAVLGIATQLSYYREYCLFGENFSRKLVPIWPAERVEETEWLVEEQEVEYLLVVINDSYPEYLSQGFKEISQSGDWILYHWEGD
ncbi:glycosyltransferase family 39 protein [Chloroflexota bacterium]